MRRRDLRAHQMRLRRRQRQRDSRTKLRNQWTRWQPALLMLEARSYRAMTLEDLQKVADEDYEAIDQRVAIVVLR